VPNSAIQENLIIQLTTAYVIENGTSLLHRLIFLQGVIMNNNNYIVIQGWMCNDLQLSGNELLIYALIYGFSQDGESEFCGSRAYIANTFNISKPTVDKSLKTLVKKGYIIKHQMIINDVQVNRYKVSLQVVKNLYGGSKEFLPHSKETLHGGSKESLLYNYNNNNYNNTDNDNKERIPPTLEQVQDYCRERGNDVDAQRFIDFYESKGWMVGKNKMKDWKACVRTWERGSKKAESPKNNDKLKALENYYLQEVVE
jgi:DNA-binding Lrp family transcriptional regulator